jgi:hypothetical protein
MLLGRLPFTLVQSNTGNPVFIGTPTVATTYETFLIIRKDQAGESMFSTNLTVTS